MANYKLLLPKMGESVEEATIIKWTKNPGDYVEADETVMEIATDKVDSDVPSPVSGRLIEQLFKDNDVVKVGAAIGIIETDEAGQAAQPAAQQTAPPAEETKAPVPEPARVSVKTTSEQFTAHAEPVPFTGQLQQKATPGNISFSNSNRFYSPLVKNIAAQENISSTELDQIPGSGAEGRLTKDDLLTYVQQKSSKPSAASPSPAFSAPVSQPISAPVSEQPAEYKGPKGASVSAGDEIIEMDRMRRLIADHMVMSKQTSPHVTSFVEADVTNLVLWRDRVKSAFEKREGEKITFTPIFIEAVVRAIKDMPMINIQLNGTQIIKKKDINISMATALPSGNLIVPVIKKADELNLMGLTKAVNDLANRARNNKLKPDDTQGGTFTITNVGSFGNVMGTPIINQPQVAILAVGAIKKKPAVIETLQGDMIAIRHMMFLSLSYDHRVVDG
ncbi:MAG: dihydrolipoamide acetyltransferase family protein, partial [Mucilaginibacter sp.]